MAKNKRCKGCKVTNFVDVKSIRLRSKIDSVNFRKDDINLSVQSFFIDSDGEIIIKEKFSLGLGETEVKAKRKNISIKKSKAKKIMDEIDVFVKANPKLESDKKDYRWDVEIRYSDGSKRFARALISDKSKKKEEEISKLIRSSLDMDSLLLLDSKIKKSGVNKLELEFFTIRKKYK